MNWQYSNFQFQSIPYTKNLLAAISVQVIAFKTFDKHILSHDKFRWQKVTIAAEGNLTIELQSTKKNNTPQCIFQFFISLDLFIGVRSKRHTSPSRCSIYTCCIHSYSQLLLVLLIYFFSPDKYSAIFHFLLNFRFFPFLA